jgi:hypothetical protein
MYKNLRKENISTFRGSLDGNYGGFSVGGDI